MRSRDCRPRSRSSKKRRAQTRVPPLARSRRSTIISGCCGRARGRRTVPTTARRSSVRAPRRSPISCLSGPRARRSKSSRRSSGDARVSSATSLSRCANRDSCGHASTARRTTSRTSPSSIAGRITTSPSSSIGWSCGRPTAPGSRIRSRRRSKLPKVLSRWCGRVAARAHAFSRSAMPARSAACRCRSSNRGSSRSTLRMVHVPTAPDWARGARSMRISCLAIPVSRFSRGWCCRGESRAAI